MPIKYPYQFAAFFLCHLVTDEGEIEEDEYVLDLDAYGEGDTEAEAIKNLAMGVVIGNTSRLLTSFDLIAVLRRVRVAEVEQFVQVARMDGSVEGLCAHGLEAEVEMGCDEEQKSTEPPHRMPLKK